MSLTLQYGQGGINVAVLAVQRVTAAGLAPSYVAASATGDSFPNDGRTVLLVKNGDTVAHTVTIISAKTCNQGFQHNLTVSVAAGATMMIGPFPVERFNNEQGQVQVNYDAVTSVTVAAVKI